MISEGVKITLGRGIKEWCVPGKRIAKTYLRGWLIKRMEGADWFCTLNGRKEQIAFYGVEILSLQLKSGRSWKKLVWRVRFKKKKNNHKTQHNLIPTDMKKQPWSGDWRYLISQLDVFASKVKLKQCGYIIMSHLHIRYLFLLFA